MHTGKVIEPKAYIAKRNKQHKDSLFAYVFAKCLIFKKNIAFFKKFVTAKPGSKH